MSKGRRLLAIMLGLAVGTGSFSQAGMTAMASGSKSYMDSLNVGVASIIDPSVSSNDVSYDQAVSDSVYLENGDLETEDVSGNIVPDIPEEPEAEESESTLVMANVQNALNVRAEATEDSEIVGKLYKDCGGRIIERRDGWTKLQSGNIVGWASDEYLLFGEEAEALANEVGNLIVTINTDALRVRKEPSTEAGVYGMIAQDDEMEVIEVVDEDWISVDYGGQTGFVSAEYVLTDFHIDAGETIQEIKDRERAEAEAKAKLTANQGAVVANADDTRLLGALIQCEAGGESDEGKLAVGAVVMNRVRSGAYPDTIFGVIYASGQFTPAINGKVAKVYAGNVNESCLAAAQAAINGETNVGEATHFKRVGLHDGYVIGNHVFW